METRVYQPIPQLHDILDNVLIFSCDFSENPGISPLYNFVPTHVRSWVFYLEDIVKVKKQGKLFRKAARSLIEGPITSPIMLDYGKKHKSIIVNFRPGGMFRVFGIPLHEFIDSEIEANLIFGNQVETLLDTLVESKSDELKNEIIQKFLLQKLYSFNTRLPFDLAIYELVKRKGNQPMDYLANQSCLSIRQFERIAKKRLGLPPKFYAKLTRFSSAYKQKELSPETTWVNIAHDCGYFDQMHFIRDFKQFTHQVPTDLTETDFKNSLKFRSLESPCL